MAALLPVQTWPAKPVLIVAINAETGERRAFDRTSGVSLVDAMIATTASFGAPPAVIDGQHYTTLMADTIRATMPISRSVSTRSLSSRSAHPLER
jgi:NTE family protein